jgi:hypothetical protein
VGAAFGKLIWSRGVDSAVDSALYTSDGALGWVYHAHGVIYASLIVEATG